MPYPRNGTFLQPCPDCLLWRETSTVLDVPTRLLFLFSKRTRISYAVFPYGPTCFRMKIDVSHESNVVIAVSFTIQKYRVRKAGRTLDNHVCFLRKNSEAGHASPGDVQGTRYLPNLSSDVQFLRWSHRSDMTLTLVYVVDNHPPSTGS